MTNLKDFAKLLYKELQKVANNETVSQLSKKQRMARLFTHFFTEIARYEHVYSATLFSQIAVVATKYRFDKRHEYFLHRFRKFGVESYQDDQFDTLFPIGLKALCESIEVVTGEAIPQSLNVHFPDQWPVYHLPEKVAHFFKELKVLMLGDDSELQHFKAKRVDNPSELILVGYNQIGTNDNFDTSVKLIQRVFKFPVMVNLLDVAMDEHGKCTPRGFVIEPDYLVDISAIADCFQPSGTDPWRILLKKFLPFTVSPPLMLGNIANYYLDELMSNPQAVFKI